MRTLLSRFIATVPFVKIPASLRNGILKEVNIGDKGLLEQVKLIQELEEKDRNTVFNIIDTMLTKARFKDFFNKNIAAL